MQVDSSVPQARVWWLRGVLVALAYFALAHLGLRLPIAGSHLALIWLPTGVAVAALWRWGDRMLIAVLAGVVLTYFSRPPAHPATLSFLVGNTLAPWVCVWVLRRLDFSPTFNARRQVPLLVGAALLGMSVSATVGIGALWLAGVLDSTRLLPAWQRWWIGDTVGVLLAAPPLMMVSRRLLAFEHQGLAWPERGITIGIALLATTWVFLTPAPVESTGTWLHGPLVFVPFLPMAWLAMRSRTPFYPSVTAIALAGIAAVGTTQGLGPVGSVGNPQFGLALLWGYLVALDLIALLMSALAGEAAEANERLQGLFDSSLDGIILGLPDGQVVNANPAAEALFGRSVAELRKLGRAGLVDPNDPRLIAALEERGRTGRVAAIVNTLHADGTVFQAEFHSTRYQGRDGVERIYAVFRNVSERERVAKALRDSEERLRMALEGGQVGLWEWEIDRGMMSWDERGCRILGLAAIEAIPDQAYRAMIHPQDYAKVEAAGRQTMVDATPFEVEHRVLRHDGSEIWIQANGRLKPSGADGQRRLVGTLIDVTERRRSAEAMVQAQTAERANQAKNQFIARISHELRTPLNAILGFSEILQLDRNHPLTPVQNDRLGKIRRAGDHLLLLINDLLDLSRIEAGALKLRQDDVDLRPVLEDCVHELAAMARQRQVAVFTEIAVQDGGFGLVVADRDRLRQVVLNLLSNAIKYNRPGGRVELRLSREQNRMSLSVIDTGEGLEPAQLASLFQPFNRLGREASAVEGTGIGLVITRSLVDLMGGELTVRSQPGEGSEFRVALPLADQRAAAATASAPAVSDPRIREDVRGSVLYVDDDEINRIVMQAFFEMRPHVELLLAENGAQGLEVATHHEPDVILLDLMMPGMSGHQVLQTVRATPRLAATPCIAVSANAMPDEVEQAMRAGFDAYLTKPLNATALLAEVDRLLARPGRAPAPARPH